ncbi:MAG TPA: class I SAM-dependent methyltransferase [Azonexus sp.]|nr:class I SAM-dependent methyltransferase [Azonexus sp.]
MPSWSVMKVLLKELATSQKIPRTNEPTLVMDDPQQVREYTLAGLEGGVMAPVYLFHCAQICQVIRPGDYILDLACGPANQLAQIARLNPDCQFVGLDLSPEMLDRARELIAAQQLANVSFVDGSITDLSQFEDDSFDVVMSTMALHHLPDENCLNQTFAEAARVLKPDGGVYLADFGRLKRKDSIDYFAYQYEDRQPPLFTLDYLNSLHAAFSLQNFRTACSQSFGDRASVLSTWCVPFMVVVKSPPRRKLPETLEKALHSLRDALPEYHKTDLANLRTFFRLGGLPSPALA